MAGREAILKDVMRKRAPQPALSTDEEVTLRRIAHGIARPRALRQSDVEQLTRFELICMRGTALVLTAMGERRLAESPNRNLSVEPLSDDPGVTAVAKALGVKR